MPAGQNDITSIQFKHHLSHFVMQAYIYISYYALIIKTIKIININNIIINKKTREL